MDALNQLGGVLSDYKQNGFRVTVEFSQEELLKLFAFILGTAICCALAIYLLQGIFKSH